MDHSNFTSIAMSVNGGLERERKHFYSKLSENIVEKKDENYSVAAYWARRKIMFSLSMQLFCIDPKAEQLQQRRNYDTIII